MKNLFKHIILFIVMSFSGLSGAYAQLYPVQLTAVFNSPYSIKISDYATSMDTKMRLMIAPTDISISGRRVRLKLYIKGNGLNIRSSDYMQGEPFIVINGGELQTLTNTDLAALFRLENLQGITAVQYANGLPEGMYDFCFEMYDFVTNQRISQKSCAMMYLILNDPPLLNTPQKNEQIAASDFPNIMFTWTPRQRNATNVSYKFELKQLMDPTMDPQFAFQMSPVLYEETLFGTALLYNLNMPILKPGMRYAWRVRAVSTTGLSENAVFKNDGYSEIYSFKYTASCAAPTFLLSEAQGPTSVKVSWQGVPEHTRYQMQYKKQDVRNAQWFSTNSLNTQSLITNLEPGVTYQFRVGSSCDPDSEGVQSFTYSGISTFTTPTQTNGVPAYNCGIIPKINIQNQKPLTNLIQSETFTAGDFPVTILELKGENSPYSGRGYIIVPYLADTKIAVEFNSIVINTDYQLINGVVETSYNPDWDNVVDIDPWVDAVKELAEEITKFLTNYSGSDEDKVKAVELEQKQKEVFEQMINDEDLPSESKTVLEGSQKETENDWNDLKNGTSCEDEIVEKEVPEKKEETNAEKPKTPKSFSCKIKKVEQQSKVVAKENEKLIEKKKITPIVIFVNGYWNNGFLQKDLLGFSDGKSLDGYWGGRLKTEIKRYFFNITDKNIYYINGADGMLSSGSKRYDNGLQFVKDRLKNKLSKFQREVFIKDRKILVVSHSMGGAFAEGLVKELTNNKMQVDKIVHLSPADNSDFKVTLPEKTFQIDISTDPVLAYFKNLNDKKHINGIKNFALVQNPDHDLLGHADTKLEGYVWHWFEDLELLKFEYKGIETETITTPGGGMGYGGSSQDIEYEKYNAKSLKYNTIFIDIMKNSKNYFYKDTKKMYYSTKK